MTVREKNQETEDIMSDVRYICKSSTLITESLQKGCDIMQMPNGDIIVTETKTVMFRYSWDENKNKFVRSQPSTRSKKNRKLSENEFDLYDPEDAD